MEYNFDELRSQIKNSEYKLLGTGSSRKVYDLENGHVAKVAKNIWGIAQNRAEHKIYISQKSKMFAEIVEVSDDYILLIMPKADKIHHLHDVYKYYNAANFKELLKLNHLKEDIKENGIGKGDLTRVTNWGLVNDVPLIIDYGLTYNIYNKYYKLHFLRKKPKPIRL